MITEACLADDIEVREVIRLGVGKEGGPKLTQSTPLSTANLFGTIDAMPMRRDDSRRGLEKRAEHCPRRQVESLMR